MNKKKVWTMLLKKTMLLLYFTGLLFSIPYDGNIIAESYSYLMKQNEEIGEATPEIEEAVHWMNQTDEDLIRTFGEPDRKDLSAYGYEWWVYTNHENYVYQFGVMDNRIETIYVIGDDQERASYEMLHEKYTFVAEVPYEQGESYYTFRLTQEDLERRPLAKADHDTFIQFYMDTFTDNLFAYRIISGNTLLTQRPYEIEYVGTLPEQPNLSEKDWAKVEEGMEQQIFDVTNVIRSQHELSPLKHDSNAQRTAYAHSKDMSKNNYFSHTSLNGDRLKERLEAEEVLYMHAAENIAAGYIDALSSMEGWLNSKSHRKTLLNSNYTHLGVGVYRFYYTQNFLHK